MRNGLRLLLLWTCLLLVPALAFATPPVPPPHRSGLLQPAEASPLVLRTVQLTVTVQENVSHAEVEGAYQVENPTGQAAAADLVWTYVDGFFEEPHPPAISVDGRAVEPTVHTDADLYRPLLEAWVEQHPEVGRTFRGRSADTTDDDWLPVVKLLADAGTGSASRGDADAMIRFVHGEATRSEIRQLTNLLLSEDVDRLRESWRPWVERWSPGIYWVRFPVTVPAGGVIAVRTLHTQLAPSWNYDFLLSGATTWSKVGPVSAVVHVPDGHQVQTNVPLAHRDGSEAIDLSPLPERLVLSVVKWPLPRPTAIVWRWLGPLLLGGAVVVGVAVVARRRRIRR